jgi:hypothetical protein
MSLADKLPLASQTVGGLVVKEEVPNMSSIDSSLDKYQILQGVRELSMDLFTYTPPYSVQEYKRTEELAKQIKESGWISPLIVVEDAQGFYILEGGHRFDALNMLEIKSFPAIVVKDLTSLSEK